MLSRFFAWWRSRGRCIFRYFDGRKWRRCDPIEMSRRLEAMGGADWEKNLECVARGPSAVPPGAGIRIKEANAKEAAAAVTSLVDTFRKSFDVPPLDDAGRGLTDGEVIELAAAFYLFLGGLADEAIPFQNSPPPVSSLTPQGSPIESLSASGEIESGSLTSNQTA